jgi:hypothetical protein
LRDSPDLFQGNRGIGSDRSSMAAARVWICDLDKLRDKMTAGLCKWGVVSKISLGWGRCRLFRWTDGRKVPTADMLWRDGLADRF